MTLTVFHRICCVGSHVGTHEVNCYFLNVSEDMLCSRTLLTVDVSKIGR